MSKTEQPSTYILADNSLRSHHLLEDRISRDAHHRAAEHHDNAKEHLAAAEHHGRGDHKTAHQQSTKALEHAKTAHEHSVQANVKSEEKSHDAAV